MLRDVFYYGRKPNVHPREKPAKNLEDARQQATTEHFWIVNEYCDYTNFDWDFDFDFLDDDQVWTQDHNNVWPSQHCKDSGTWLCPKIYSDKIVYRTDVHFVKRMNIKTEHWIELEKIDNSSFDFSWHPDPTEPPYIYAWGCRYYPLTHSPVLEYRVQGATEYKYMDTFVELLPDKTNYKILHEIEDDSFDFRWRPDVKNPPYIYVWGNQHHNATVMPTIEYHVLGATERHYMDSLWHPKLKQKPENFQIFEKIKDFDYSWVPDPNSPPYIYVWGNQWNSAEKEHTVLYHVEGATEYKYMPDIAYVLPDKSKFKVLHPIVDESFDFSWRPDPYDPPYNYIFGNNKYNSKLMPTIIYQTGATEDKHVDVIVATLDIDMKNWYIPDNIDIEGFDFTWLPDPTSPPYIYEFATIWNDRGGPVYTVSGANEYKYVTDIRAKTKYNNSNFVSLLPIDEESFDYTWTPHPNDPPYIYIFGNQWNTAEREPTVAYHVPGATEKKYITSIIATVLENKENFVSVIPVESFDFSWRPDPYDLPYIYIFGNTQYPAEIMPTIKYIVPGATTIKYISYPVAKLGHNLEYWHKILPVDENKFDFSWVPDPTSPPYIYVFGNQWNDAVTEPTLEYRVPNATQRKYMPQTINVLPNYDNWKTIIPVENNFDFTWRPNPNDPPYIYIFGNQWNKAEVEPTLVYTVENAKSKKYIENIVAEVSPDMSNWIINQNIDVRNFDFSWRPNPGSPPYIYQFGTLQDDNDGPKYVTPDNNGEIVRLQRVEKKIKSDDSIPKYYIKTTLEDLIEDHPNELFWAIRKNINYTNFDFTWRPNIEQARYVQVFGSPEAIETQTYFVSAKMYNQGYTKFNFITSEAKIENEYLAELFEQPDMFFIDRGNIESKNRYEQLKQRFPKIQKARYHNGWVETIYRCLNKCNTQLAWILNSELDYSDFDFKYYPNPWQMKMIHVFGTQWSHWGTTYMINKDTFIEDTKYIKIIEHLSNINFVKNRIAKAMNCLYDVYLIDHGNDVETTKNQLENKIGNSVRVVPYKESYLKTFKNMLQSIEPKKEHYIWICSSVCDYENFDFGYICDPFAKENLHVFPSNKQKFGDTFLVDVNKMRLLINDLKQLEDFEKVNYNQHLQARRLQAPIFVVNEDTHYNSYDVDYKFPYALFLTKDNENLLFNYNEPMSLWHSKNIEILSTGGSLLAIPKQINEHVSEELYDYPNIIKAKNIIKSNPLDIVYLSNGEKTADENYEHLLKITKGLPNRVVRIDGINGRVAAYHSVAQASNTPWMFTVFAKLKIDDKFDFSWQPDRLQIPKHYIFTAKNPINGLIYGHQAMIAYNKKLVLKNKGKGLDFTLDDPHMVVDIFSGIATFNTDAYSTWRTAFREVIKLKSDYTDISQERLRVWLSKAEGNFAEQCLQGAKDAVDYYDSVMGDIDQLKLSYEWDWLLEYYNRKYK